MLEDIQLRCELAADRMVKALKVGLELQGDLPKEFAESFALNLTDLGRFQRRALAYAYHLRETNLATLLRAAKQDNDQALVDKLASELQMVMKADLENVCAEELARVGDPAPKPTSTVGVWPEMEAAIASLQEDMAGFLDTYLNEGGDSIMKGRRGWFSVTSR